jgi:sec-independent protein translocase protein TatC
MMPIELQQIKSSIVRVFACFTIVTFFTFALSVRWVHVLFFTIPLPGGLGESISGTFIQNIKTNLLPAGTTLAVSNPLEAFTVTVGISATIGVVFSLMLAAYELWRFARPGLYPQERKGFLFIFLSSLVLLYAGAQFGFSILTPAIYAGLYGFTPHNVLPIYNLGEVVGQVVGIMFASAVSFLLPVAMTLLSAATIVPVSFWRGHWRHALFIIIVASAIITPDGSGVSMILLGIPLCLLYILGYAASAYVMYARNKKQRRVK